MSDTEQQPQYGFRRVLEDATFEQACERITEALAEEGFGILTTIDVEATLKKKLDVDTGAYTILGACSPKMAHQALELERSIGLLLPCNVVVYERDDQIVLEVIDPHAMFEVVDNPNIGAVADEVAEQLERALASA